jgi:hypothetical protein
MTRKVDDLTAGDSRLRDGAVRDGGSAGPSLSAVTPGLDRKERVRSAALRAIAFTRAFTHDVAAIIDKGVAAASEEARAAWKRWSPPKEPKSDAPPSSPGGDAPPPASG